MKRAYLFFIFLSFILSLSAANASVTLMGTRVIYPANAKFVSLNFTSTDKVPSIMEVWASLKDVPSSTASDANAPFVVTPQVFRIDPKTGQSVKLAFTGAQLPQDRESLFYLNFVQIPAIKKENQQKNRLLVSYRSTVKIFYRPATLKGDAQNTASQLKIDARKSASGSVKVINPTEYYVTVSGLDFKQNGKTVISLNKGKSFMVEPFSESQISVKPTKINPSTTVANIRLINDYGGISEASIRL